MRDVLLMLVFKSSLLWHLQGEMLDDNTPQTNSLYQYHLSKMSRVCMFVAETCGKCTQLKSCFWCANDGAGEGRCYADSDSVAKGKCIGKVSAYWQNIPCSGRDNRVRDENTERSVLVKLLLLLRKLRDSRNNELLVQEVPDTKILNQDILEKAQTTQFVQPTQTVPTNPDFLSTSQAFNELSRPTNNTSKANHTEKPTATPAFSTLRNSISTLSNRTVYTTPNASFYNTTELTLELIAGHVNVSNAVMLYHAPCYGMTRTSCLRKPICSWCRGNATCCRWRPKKSKKTTSRSGNDLVCPKVATCEACISSNAKCYWCSAGSKCQFYPGESYVKLECDGKVSYKTCAQDIPVYVFALCIILVTFFLSFGYLCARKCYYFQLKPVEVKLEERPILFKKKNGRTVYQITESEEEDEEELFRNGKDAYTPSKVGLAPNNPAVW